MSERLRALRRQLEAAAADRRPAIVGELIRCELARVLGLASPEAVAGGALRELGVTAALAVELSEGLSRALQHPVVAGAVLEASSAAALTARLVGELAAARDAPAAAPPAAVRGAVTDGDAVAIVAMACRYPGGIATPEALWQLVERGGDAITRMPARSGWDVEAMYDPDPDAPGKSVTREGGLLGDAGLFDPTFFGVSPREAERLDPQQRLLLETAWEALERAAIVPATLERSLTGVYAGVMYNDYGWDRFVAAPAQLDGHIGVGSYGSTATGRISYTLGLQGPAITIDTACSSSLVAIHLAIQALRQGEIDLALAGGVAVMGTPATFIEWSRQRGLAPDGRCKSFSDDADGVGFSEGCGMLVLQRVADARRHGRRVLAVVRGSAVNQDGRSWRLTAPNAQAQERVIRQALASAGIEARDVDAVEAHGTGTLRGDPVEVSALQATYGAAHTAEAPLYLGSLKSNLGHTQAAAGVAGIIKMVLALEREALPPSRYADRPSRRVDWSDRRVQLLDAAVAWPRRADRVRRAGVSSFGLSGTNAHLIIEEPAPAPARIGEPRVAAAVGAAIPLVISGIGDAALRANAGRLADHLRARPALAVLDVAYSLATTRTAFARRAALIAAPDAPRDQLIGRLAALAAGGAPGDAVLPADHARGKLVVLFTGQGSQRAAMGRALAAADAGFRRHLEAVAAALDRHLARPVLEIVSAGDGALDRTEHAQPALFALEVALFRRLAELGVTADLLLGHSVGELAAAHVAGVLALDDAARLVAARGRLMQACRGDGAMVSIAASEAELAPHVPAGATIAGLNGPRQTVVSGDAGAVEALARQFEHQGRKVRRLVVSHAFHSPHMDGMLDAFERVAADCAFHPPNIPIVSNVTGRLATADELCSPAYWARHVRSPVRFLDGIQAALADGATAFVECGPDAVLCGMASACLPEGRAATFAPALRRTGAEPAAFAAALAAVHVAGHAVAWRDAFAGTGARVVDLPTYGFQREHYWLDAPAPAMPAASGALGAGGDRPLWDAIDAGDAGRVASLLALPDELRGGVDPLLDHIAAWRQTRQADAQVADWLYDETWQPAAAPAADAARLDGTWLVVHPAAAA
ncbi:MAG TPA: beta-ketoacyl synthase N-terminal-like domain-containing protein, partial [Kofleriaceae bacterium]|nr:beta-ketoacyl synthase N-terminal-like domain-containing protein [Kofleriaceae bacterium]